MAVMEHDPDMKREDVVETRGTNTPEVYDEKATKLNAKTYLAVLAVGLIYFAQLVTLVGAGAQGQTIAGHFNGSDRVAWFTATITILTVVIGPPVSQAADYWGRKPFLLVLSVFGAIGSVIVARADSMDMAIAGFATIGISFGAQPLLHTVVSEVLPRRYRGYGQAANMISNALGTIFGLLVGGALNRTNDPTADGFRTYFLITMGWYIAAVILAYFSYNPPETDKQKEYRGRTMEKLKKLDWIGYLLLASGLVLFCVGLSWSENPYPWTDAHVSATFAVGLVLALALVLYETLIKKDGMFHHGLFKRGRNFPVALFCVFAEGVAFFAANTYFAFQVSVLYETDAVLVGTRYSIMLIASCVGASIAGIYCAVTRKVRWITVLAFVIFVAFFAAMSQTDRTTDTPVWGYPVLLGMALGMTLTTLVTVAQLCTPPELIAVASGLIISVRSLGGTIGVAIYQALFVDQMNKMPANIAEAVIPLGVSPSDLPAFIGALNAHDAAALMAIPNVDESVIGAGTIALLDTYASSFQIVWIAASAFVALATVVAFFLKDPENEFNMHVDAPLDKNSSAESVAMA